MVERNGNGNGNDISIKLTKIINFFVSPVVILFMLGLIWNASQAESKLTGHENRICKLEQSIQAIEKNVQDMKESQREQTTNTKWIMQGIQDMKNALKDFDKPNH